MTRKRTIAHLVAGGLAAFLLSACGADSERAAGAARTEELAKRVQYLEDVAAIQRVQSRYAHYLFTQDFDKIVEECFPKNIDDVTVEFSDSGVFRGLESVKALYKAFEVTKQIPGFFILHMTVNPYIDRAEPLALSRRHRQPRRRALGVGPLLRRLRQGGRRMADTALEPCRAVPQSV